MVLVDQPSQDVFAAHVARLDRVPRRTRSVRQGQPDASVWSGLVVVGDVARGYPFEVAPAEHQNPVQALSSGGADEALRGARIALGARIGVGMTATSSVRRTSSKDAVNFESWSRIRYRLDCSGERSRTERFLACWVTHAESGCAVTPASVTRRVARSITNRTYITISRMVSTVKKSVARTPFP